MWLDLLIGWLDYHVLYVVLIVVNLILFESEIRIHWMIQTIFLLLDYFWNYNNTRLWFLYCKMGCLQLHLGFNSKFSCVCKGEVKELGRDIIFPPISLPNYNVNWNLCLWRGFLVSILFIWVPLTVRTSTFFVIFFFLGLNWLFLGKLPFRKFLFS